MTDKAKILKNALGQSVPLSDGLGVKLKAGERKYPFMVNACGLEAIETRLFQAYEVLRTDLVLTPELVEGLTHNNDPRWLQTWAALGWLKNSGEE
jgi:hypothetical protein